MAVRRRSTTRLCRSFPWPRRMRSSIASAACWSGMSTYGTTRGMVREKVEQRVVDRLGIEIEEAHPAHALARRPRSGRGRASGVRPSLGQVAPVGDRVLRDEVQLDDALRREPLGFAHDVVGASATAACPRRSRDDAEGAGAVAPLGDLQVRARPRVGDDARVARPDDPVGGVADEHPLGVAARAPRPSLSMSLEPRKWSTSGICAASSRRVALREAAGDDELLAGAVLLHLGELEDRLDRLLLRLADEAARVDDDDLGVVASSTMR